MDAKKNKKKNLMIIAFAIIIAAAVIATACAISANKKYRSTWTNIDDTLKAKCSMACDDIDVFLQDGRELDYGYLMCHASAITDLIYMQWDEGKIKDHAVTSRMMECLDNLICYPEESKLYLDVLKEALEYCRDGRISTFELRLTTFNNCVSAERQND